MTIKSNTFIHAKEFKCNDGGSCVFAYEFFQGRSVILTLFTIMNLFGKIWPHLQKNRYMLVCTPSVVSNSLQPHGL